MRIILTILALFLAPTARAEDLTVFAAASLKTALDEIAASFSPDGDQVVISYGGSSALARQIIAGAPADIFISASTDWMDQVQQAGLVADGSRRELLGNRLVLIAHGKAPQTSDFPDGLADLLAADDARLAMAMVDAVPAGVYGKQALESLGQWDALAPHVAQADNVRAALALVATGAAPFGITYASDAVAEPAVSVIYSFPETTHDRIIYPAALIGGNRAAAFLDALGSPEARRIFEENGFLPLQ